MRISVVTPSYNMLDYLRRCAASVRDQSGPEFEHIVMDGGSTDGTVEWLREQPQIQSVSGKDGGMYDAVNRGLLRARGDVAAYLNCDEQYLLGTLEFVESYFQNRPETDVLFGSVLVVRPDGSLISYRKAYPPRAVYCLTDHLPVFSCAMFFRRKIIEDGFLFDTSFRANGDNDFVVRLLQAGYRVAVTRRYLSAFTQTGSNLGASGQAREEWRRLLMRAPRWARVCRRPLTVLRRLEKLARGAYFQRFPIEYAIYVPGESERKTFTARKADFRWKNG